jgi:pimeloyl-ACP methyl ester carboxylesterase
MIARAHAACSEQPGRDDRPLEHKNTFVPLRRGLLLTLLHALCLTACAKGVVASTPLRLGGLTDSVRLELDGIGDCNAPRRSELALDPKLPLVVLVHGSHSSADSFRALAESFALHDQQTVCFRYPDRERLATSAARLRRAISRLARALHEPEITIFGHSQGGLIARAALSAPELTTATGPDLASRPLPLGSYRLVTVSSPFGGIRAARQCGSIPYHIASLGVSLVVCRAISGPKWNEIHPRSQMVKNPNTLDPMVREHLTIVTDERDTCRRYSLDGSRCLQDDYVFSLAEQRNQRIELDDRVIQSAIAAGHIEVLGVHSEPKKLLQVLQQNGLLRTTRLDKDQPAAEHVTAKHGW